MQPPLKRLSTGTGQQAGQRMQDVDENFGRVEQAIDTLNSGAVIGRGTLANNTDLNTVKTSGVYLLSYGNTYTNMPAGATSGILIVFAPFGVGASDTESQAVQWFVSWSASYERYATSTHPFVLWSNWR